MAAPGSNSSQPSTPNLPQKKPIPVPRNQVKSKISANNVYQNKNLHGKVNTSIYDIPRQNEVEHYRNLLQQKIEQQSSEQSVAITTADILKLNVPFFSKYRVISLQKMLKDNEGTSLDVYLETFEILKRYSYTLLKPEDQRDKSWREIRFETDEYKKIGSVKMVTEILKSLGYIFNIFQEDGTVVGLTFPQDHTVNKSTVLKIAADLNLAKSEMEAIKEEKHPQIRAIMKDDLFPRSLLPRRLFAEQTDIRRLPPLPKTSVNTRCSYPFVKVKTTISVDQKSDPGANLYEVIPDDDKVVSTRPLGRSSSDCRDRPLSKCIYCPMCGLYCGGKANFCQRCGAQVSQNYDQNGNSIAVYNDQHQLETRSMSYSSIDEKADFYVSEEQIAAEETGWGCEYCTYFNPNCKSNICEMCCKTTDSLQKVKQKT